MKTVLILTCIVLGLAGCRRAESTQPPMPSVGQVQSALAKVQGRTPYKSFVVDRMEPLGGGAFAVLFKAPDPNYKGSGALTPFPLHGSVTNNGYLINCILVDDEGKSISKGETILIPFEQQGGGYSPPAARPAQPTP